MSTDGEPSGTRAKLKHHMDQEFLPTSTSDQVEYRTAQALEYIAYQLFKIREALEQKSPPEAS